MNCLYKIPCYLKACLYWNKLTFLLSLNASSRQTPSKSPLPFTQGWPVHVYSGVTVTSMFVFIHVDFIFAGHLLKDEKTLDSYGIQDGFTIYVMKKCPEPEPIGMKDIY